MTRFVDQATLRVEAGRGGKGCRSFYQDLWTRHPIPDGGDGGSGGDVILRVDPQLTTLLDFQTQRHFRAGNGGHASSKGKHGFRGGDCLISVPPGTVIWDDETHDLILELLTPGEEVRVARGGAGGVGNKARRKAQVVPRSRRWEPSWLDGKPGETRRLKLQLKLVADCGIVGMPNAGKSTLIRQISAARPKVAPFPFTTTHPVLGAVTLPLGSRIIAVDVPGLIEGAHLGKGLGLDFLRHIERTRLLVHLIDMAGADGRDPVEDYKTLNRELASYSQRVAAKPQIVAANKMDLPQAQQNLVRFRKKVKVKVVRLCAMTGKGVDRLLELLEKKDE